VFDLLGMTNRAVLEYEEALQYDPTSYLTHLRLGAGYARLNMLPGAIEELKLVHKYNPEDMQSHYLLALIYSTRREYTLAAEEYELILKTFSEAEPQNIQIYSYLGQLYYSQKKYDKAIEQYEKILTFEPKNADVLYLLGSLYWEVGDRKLAVDLLEQSVVIDPQHDSSLNTLGYFYAENDMRLDEANDLIVRALAISPENGGYLDSLGWVYYKKGMYQEALETLIKADQYLKDPVIYDHMGDVYQKLNHLEDAIKYWELSLQLLPKQEAVINKINTVRSELHSQVNSTP
jgi:tetratricopeptide (TPR) repeat protein